jgi:hypothetical protein
MIDIDERGQADEAGTLEVGQSWRVIDRPSSYVRDDHRWSVVEWTRVDGRLTGADESPVVI